MQAALIPLTSPNSVPVPVTSNVLPDRIEPNRV
jgi:hypothetical protein